MEESLPTDIHTTKSRPCKSVDEYNISKIVVKGNNREHWINVVKVLEFEAGMPDWN